MARSGLRDVLIHCFHKLVMTALQFLPHLLREPSRQIPLLQGPHLLGSRTLKEIPYLHLNKLQELGVIHHISLVEVDNYVGNPYLTSQENVLTSLGHRPICSTHNQDRSIHLSRTRDHVLYVVSMTWAIDVGVVPS